MNDKHSNPVSENYGWSLDEYQLIDFGAGRKLERFGSQLLDRPSPAALHADPQQPQLWSAANFRVDEKGNCVAGPSSLAEWCVRYGPIQFLLRITPFGHVGLFPEHAITWNWLTENCSNHSDSLIEKCFLNLFAYTGGASLVMAACGWQVVHVDSAAPTVTWARENAKLSGLNERPIRWLIDDARAFVARELRRGRAYDAILLDPPAYGHGLKGKPWLIDRDLPALLDDCCQLLTPAGVIILTGHSETHHGQDPFDLLARLRAAGHANCQLQFGRTVLRDVNGRSLDFGWHVRVTC